MLSFKSAFLSPVSPSSRGSLVFLRFLHLAGVIRAEFGTSGYLRNTGFPRWLSGNTENTPANAGDVVSIPGSGRSPGGGNGSPVFLLGKSHGQRNLVGFSPRVAKSRTRLGAHTR